MSKKNAVLGAVLGFFVFGIFYSTGVNKKGVTAFLGLCIAEMVLSQLPLTPVWIAPFVGGYLGYKWVNEHNAQVETGDMQPQF